mmetsp:Transcript_12899/g.29194  ORF Transcript_12899/g.29194 Transcript_12899/m.29194 type:complete len:467 (-) Transcript_12899:32-1432(-)
MSSPSRRPALPPGNIARPLHWITQVLRKPSVQRGLVLSGKYSLGIAAAGAGLALGLHEVKKALHAHEPENLWQSASVRLREGPSDGNPFPKQDARAALQRLASRYGFEVEAFQKAARLLHPVELQFQELWEAEGRKPAAELQAAEAACVQHWRDRGYLASQPRVKFGRRCTSDAQGVNIDAQVPPHLVVDPSVPSCSPASWSKENRSRGVDALRRWGCVLVHNAVTADDVYQLREELGLGNGMAKRRGADVTRWLLAQDPNIQYGRYTFGRSHQLLRGSPVMEPIGVAVHAAVAPLVNAYFAEAVTEGAHVYLSEVQMIVADPFAAAQFWHLDNTLGPCLTVIVPLSDIGRDRGTQQVLAGTHALHDHSQPVLHRIQHCLKCLFRLHGPSEPSDPAPWRAGDAFVLDGRLLHRGADNDDFGSPSAVVLLRYDLDGRPFPGCTKSWLRFTSRLGNCLEQLMRLYTAV